MTSKTKLSDRLSVKLEDKEHEVFMSFGLLNELTTLVDDPSRVPAIPIDPVLRTAVLGACFAQRKKSGKVEKPVDMEDIDVSIEDAENTVAWVMDHLTSFFVRALRKVVAVSEANKVEAEALASSLSGSKA